MDEGEQSAVPVPGSDADIASFRQEAHRAVDWIAEYLRSSDRFPVMSRNRPGMTSDLLPSTAPEEGEGLSGLLGDFERIVLPGISHWNSPEFMAYFAISGSPPGILGEMVMAGLNVNAMVWQTSPAATELEQVVLGWLRDMLGLPHDRFGILYDTASIGILCALAAARETIAPEVGEAGLMAGPQLRMYTSCEANLVVDKAAVTLGIGRQNVRKIPVDGEFRMDVAALREAVAEDRRNGLSPFCVVATVGTTSTTSIDPIASIADVCELEGLWLHVDAAYAGTAAIVPELRWVLDGCDRADSVTVNPHKWLFVPLDCSALYVRRPQALRSAFSSLGPYLQYEHDERAVDLMDYGPQLGRRFRALKLWFVLKAYGLDGIKLTLRRHIELAQGFEDWVSSSAEFELMAPRPLSTVCFRARPPDFRDQETLNAINSRLLDLVNASGDAYLSRTVLNGAFTLRLAIGHLRTSTAEVQRVKELLVELLPQAKLAAGRTESSPG